MGAYHRFLTVLSLLLASCGNTAASITDPTPISSSESGSETRPSQTVQKIQVRVEDLPSPYASNSASQPPQVIPRPAGAKLQVPPGFTAQIFAQGLSQPRWLTVAQNGDVLLAESYDNRIRLLRDTNGDGQADVNTIFAENLNQPLGMGISPDQQWFYVANTNAVVRFPYQIGQTRLQGQPQQITELPGNGYRQHWTRNLIFSPDGQQLFVSVGSRSNVEPEPLPRASIQVMDLNGRNRQTYASGLRNPVGLAFNPVTGKLFTTVNERDGLGDDLVPDYLTAVQPGAFYGWPYSYLGANPDPRLPRNPQLEAKTIVPDVLFQAHSAALGLTFYTGKQFPSAYHNDAFVAFRGSWNRSAGTGYKIVRVPFDDQGQPEGHYEDFVTGWLVEPRVPSVWGRPVGVAIATDGSLLITDEPGGIIWRISYTANP
jgi:glucose/arabinose dehydrogenase